MSGTPRWIRPGSCSSTEIVLAMQPTVRPQPTILAMRSSLMQFCSDTTKPSGHKFVQDGTRLWVSSTPAAGSRNIFTVLPGSSDLVAFTAANVAQIDDYLNVSDPATLIEYVRAMPMGAVVGLAQARIPAGDRLAADRRRSRGRL